MQASSRDLAAVFLGGVVGALARAGLVEAFPAAPGHWPWVTFAVNLAGAAIIGLAVARLAPPSPARWFVAPGLCGALTTFSTMQLELLRMLEHDRPGLALGYVAASLAGGMLVVWAAVRLGGGERHDGAAPSGGVALPGGVAPAGAAPPGGAAPAGAAPSTPEGGPA